MAAAFLAASGIDLDAEMSRVQFGAAELESKAASSTDNRRVDKISNVTLPAEDSTSRWDVNVSSGQIESVNPHRLDEFDLSDRHQINGRGALLTHSLCHPHVHLDKAFLLSHPRYSHLQIEEGSFSEAMELTGKAKTNFERGDLLERGNRLVDESVRAGVTAMRAFVEVDPIVGMKCLEAGKTIKEQNAASDRCNVQLCAFAQLPLFSADDGGEEIRKLMQDATAPDMSADVIGSTPYVEADRKKMEQNVDWMIKLALEKDMHLDFHLDYNIDPDTEPLIWYVIDTLKARSWTKHTEKSIVLGHCTRLSLFRDADWSRLKEAIGDLPISLVGLPTSDLFMMRTEHGARGTLPIPQLIQKHGLDAAIGMNNIGNAFTPHGCCDPLSIASMGVGIYQAGTKRDAEILYECVSTRARAAIGLSASTTKSADGGHSYSSLAIKSKQPADLILFSHESVDWRTRRTVAEAVYLYDGANGRRVIKAGSLIE
ncbi:hypothetical protein MBLNU459_g0115t1 [Dothideomycetes sp. NU459]